MSRKLPNTKEWQLDPQSEYRFELDPGSSVVIKACILSLVKGRAEIFGAELALDKSYLFGEECKAAVFTWTGCTIEMRSPSTDYVSEETPMSPYANLHIAFEQIRVKALSSLRGSPPPFGAPAHTDPPRVLVLGPENSGKTTVCKILCNYAVRAGQGWAPIFVNLDPSEGGPAVPGTMSAFSVTSSIPTATPSLTLGSAATSAPMVSSSHVVVPIAYWHYRFGHAEPRHNPLLFGRLVRNLGVDVDSRMDTCRTSYAAGLFVDTPSSIAFASSSSPTNDQRRKLIQACVEAFKINVIVVVGHEKLNVEMQREFGSRLTVVKIPKSGGVVELDHSYRERVQNYQLHAYFYGQVVSPPPGISDAMLGGESTADMALSPSSTTIDFRELTIYRIGAATMAPSSALPIGATRALSETQPVLVDPAQPGSGLLNSVLAVLAPLNDEGERYDEELLDLTVIGFLVVTHVDIPARKLTILAPNLGSVRGKTVLLGSFEWQE
ncbi:hypothetical protein FISHEDRAFT_38058 [Fistulina hepatica ATCC 64428]|nr:hypothetical protein FISHEDRAFT_38058 [Fistulina hepatica ATCC 64428]